MYLKNLSELYSRYEWNIILQYNFVKYFYFFRTLKLSSDLSCFDMGSDSTYLSKLTTNIFQKYLDSYVR